jgi:DNA-binding transcriptional LysR family regulator
MSRFKFVKGTKRGSPQRLQDGDADFGFASDFEPAPDLKYKPLVQDQVGLLCRADHALARGRGPLAWKDLAGLRFAAFGPQTALRRLVEGIGSLPREVAEPAYEVADVITLESLLEAGLAVATAFKLGMYRGRDRKLVFRPLVEPALTRMICLITHSERALSPAAAALIEDTIKHLRRRTDGLRLQNDDCSKNQPNKASARRRAGRNSSARGMIP